jgi:excisionase family DNA binding protein
MSIELQSFNPKPKNFYTQKELAEYLSVSKSKIDRMLQKRQIPFYRIGRSLRFRVSDIENYLDDNRINSFRPFMIWLYEPEMEKTLSM